MQYCISLKRRIWTSSVMEALHCRLNTISHFVYLAFFLLHYWANKWWSLCCLFGYSRRSHVFFNLQPNMSCMKLTQALSFVLWGEKSNSSKKIQDLLLSVCTFSHLLKCWERFCLSKKRFSMHVTCSFFTKPKGFAVSRYGPNPPKLSVYRMGAMLYLFPLSVFKGSTWKPLMFL